MRSGIKPDEQMIEEFKNVKIARTEKVWVLSINESQSRLEVLLKGGKDFEFKNLADQLPSNEPRFVVYDFDYETDEKPPRKTNKLIFVFWCPLTSGATKRFKYSSSISEVVSTLGAIQKQLQIDDYSGIDYDEIRKQLLK
jgi:cofilin